LADLNSKDLRNYFKGVRKLCDELEARKEDLEVLFKIIGIIS